MKCFLIKINENFYILFMFGMNYFALKNVASCQNIFSCEEIFCELLLTTKLKYVFLLEFCMFVYYISIHISKNFKNKFSFVPSEQSVILFYLIKKIVNFLNIIIIYMIF
jgi:hypothetical protein